MSRNEKRIWSDDMHATMEKSIKITDFVENDMQQEMNGKILDMII